MRTNITLNLLKNLKPKSSPYFIRATSLKGFGIKVYPSGIIKFIAETKYQGVNHRKTLGAFPILSVQEAEKEAISFLNQVQTGKLEEAKRQKYTLRDLFNAYTSKVSLKLNTRKNYKQVIFFYLKDWLDKPVVSITKPMIEKRFFKIKDKGIGEGKPTYSQATKTMRILSALMNYAVADELIEYNPVTVLKLKRVDRHTVKREHYLKADEARELLEIALKDKHPVALAIRLMLYTGLRKNEALRLSWDDIDNVNGIDCLLIRDTKNHRPHYLPITDPIRGILEEAQSPSEYVFPSKLGGYAKDERPTVRRLSKALGVSFRCHDLRRTFATRATEVGIDYLTVKRILNHKSNDITAQYIQWHSLENLNAMKEALERVAY